MEWRVSAYAWNDATTKREIRAATTRKLSLRLNAPSTFACSILGQHPQAKLITELITDVTVRADGVDLIRARCGMTQDTVAESGHGVAYSFVDYRGVLARRKMNLADTLAYAAGTEQSDIAWGIITNLQSRSNGNYGITRGVGSTTGITRQWSMQPGEYGGRVIDSIGNTANGYDWDVDPAMAFNLYYPSRGSNLGVGLEYGKTVSAFTRTKNPSSFANDDTITGSNAIPPIEKASATVATDPQGRWDGVFSYPDISNATTLDDRGNWVIARTALLLPAYNVLLKPGLWKGPSHIGLGDTVRLRVVKGRINDNVLLRVIEIAVDIGDSGGEDVRLSLAGA